MQINLAEDLRRLEAETFEIEEINNIGIDAPAVIVDDGSGGGEFGEAWSSSSCSTSSCCSCSTSSCCSCSTSCGSCG